MIKQLLIKMRNMQLFLTVLGTILGLALLMCGVTLIFQLNSVVNQEEILGADFIEVNKKITVLNTLAGGAGKFTDDEIKQLQQVSGVEKIGIYIPTLFDMSMQLESDIAGIELPAIKTDVAFEAINESFVDVQSGFFWSEKSNFVPIIVPRNYLRQYNLAFAGSKGMPVIPEQAIQSLLFHLKCEGNGNLDVFTGKIVGFSDRITSFIVPEKFVLYANKKFGNDKNILPSRILIKAKTGRASKLINVISEKGYEANEEYIKNLKRTTLAQIILGITGVIGLIIVILALNGFIQYNQLMANRSAYEIHTLFCIGFNQKQIAKPYLQFSFKTIVISFIIGLVIYFIANLLVISVIKNLGIELGYSSLWSGILVGIMLATLMFYFTKKNVNNEIVLLIK